MVDRKQLLNNRSLKFGPNSLVGLVSRANSRALVVGSAQDLSALPRMNDYFDLVVVEDPDYLEQLGTTVPDLICWRRASCYLDGNYELEGLPSGIVAISWSSVGELVKLNKTTGYCQVPYLSGGEISNRASEVRSIPAGLAKNAEGVHLAKISGCVTIYDTEGRAGTTLATPQVLAAMVANTDKYGISTFWLGANRPTVMEKL